MPGEYGDFSLAVHRAYTSNKFFSNLDKVEDVSLNDNSKKEITLVTCTHKYIGSHRLIVKELCVD